MSGWQIFFSIASLLVGAAGIIMAQAPDKVIANLKKWAEWLGLLRISNFLRDRRLKGAARSAGLILVGLVIAGLAGTIYLNISSQPSAAASGFGSYRDCRGFYPNSSPSFLKIVDQLYGTDNSFWNGVKSLDEIYNGLNVRWRQLETAHDPEAHDVDHQWRAMLRHYCELLYRTSLTPADRFAFFENLTTIYLQQITYQQQSPDNSCSKDAPLQENAVQMWVIWNAYNNRLYVEAIERSRKLIEQLKGKADNMESSLEGDVKIPGAEDTAARCEVLKRGPLNDVAAAEWVLGKSQKEIGLNPSEAFSSVMCHKHGLVLGIDGEFWQPAGLLDKKYKCH